MEVQLDGSMEQVVKQAVTAALVNKLDKILPKMVEEILTDGGRFRNDETVGKALRVAVKKQVDANIAEFIVDREQQIRLIVRQKLEQVMSPEAIANDVSVLLRLIMAAEDKGIDERIREVYNANSAI